MENIFSKRYSVRKYTDKDVSNELIEEIISDAAMAPSGKNAQNWHVVVVKDSVKKSLIEEAIFEKVETLSEKGDSDGLEKVKKMSKYLGWFKNAPVVFLVYASEYLPTGIEMLEDLCDDFAEVTDLYETAPGIQNIGAFVENMLLSASLKGLGGCWMTAPMFAAREITAKLSIDLPGFKLTTMIPMGYPTTEEIPEKNRKPVSEIITYL